MSLSKMKYTGRNSNAVRWIMQAIITAKRYKYIFFSITYLMEYIRIARAIYCRTKNIPPFVTEK